MDLEEDVKEGVTEDEREKEEEEDEDEKDERLKDAIYSC